MRGVEVASAILLLVLAALGLLAVLQMHAEPFMPLEPFESAEGIPWRMFVAVYCFLVLSGLCVITSLPEVFGISKLEPILREGLVMALVTLLVGLMVIAFDLEQVTRSYYAMIGHVNTTSVMFWMIMFYVLYFVFLLVEMWLFFYDDLLRQKGEGGLRGLVARILTIPRIGETKDLAKVVGFFAAFTSVVASSNLGALFGVNYLPLWFGPILPIYFVLTAILTGTALVVIGIYVTDSLKGLKVEGERLEAIQMLRTILGFLIVVTIFFTAWRLLITGYSNSTLLSRESSMLLISGEFAFNFWVMEVLVGLLIPLVLLAVPQTGRRAEGIFAASLLTIVGVFFLRVDFVMAGMAPKLITGMRFPSPVYHPLEVIATVGFFALTVLLYYVLYKLLPVEVVK